MVGPAGFLLLPHPGAGEEGSGGPGAPLENTAEIWAQEVVKGGDWEKLGSDWMHVKFNEVPSTLERC